MCRIPRSLLLLLLLASPCPAGWIALGGPDGRPGDIVLAGNGNFSGTASIATATGDGTPVNDGRTFSLVGAIDFSFRAASGNIDSQFSYLTGSLTLVGSFDGGPGRTLLSATFFNSQVYTDGQGHWSVEGGNFRGPLDAQMGAAFGALAIVNGQLRVEFTLPPGQPGESLASVAAIRISASTASTPEPASALLVALAAPLVLAWRRIQKCAEVAPGPRKIAENH